MKDGQKPAKVLLFGEYTVLFGGRALAIPAEKWSGRLVTMEGDPDKDLLAWTRYLEASGTWPAELARTLREDLEYGLKFDSSIPYGYGLGSSGALCAAMFEKYRPTSTSMEEMHPELTNMESFFHGTSSGMDPLVSFLNSPVLREGDLFHPMPIDFARPGTPLMFLLDSGVPRETAPLVARFRLMGADAQFVEKVRHPWKIAADHAIGFYLDGEWEMFWQFLTQISLIQYDGMREFIPASIGEIWKDTSTSDDLRIKLCGAGGGGFFLGFARDGEALKRALSMPGTIALNDD